MSDNTGSFKLPSADYIVNWDAHVYSPGEFGQFLERKSYVTISLEARIRESFHEPEEMRSFLDSKGIPLLSIKKYDETPCTWGKAIYKGFSEEVGDYNLILALDATRKERIILNAKRKRTTDFGGMQKLVDCVREYISLYEAKNNHRSSASQDSKKDTVIINLPAPTKPTRAL